ncbi:hypothetical protein AKO1_006012, partial [Acrasis kona]
MALFINTKVRNPADTNFKKLKEVINFRFHNNTNGTCVTSSDRFWNIHCQLDEVCYGFCFKCIDCNTVICPECLIRCHSGHVLQKDCLLGTFQCRCNVDSCSSLALANHRLNNNTVYKKTFMDLKEPDLAFVQDIKECQPKNRTPPQEKRYTYLECLHWDIETKNMLRDRIIKEKEKLEEREDLYCDLSDKYDALKLEHKAATQKLESTQQLETLINGISNLTTLVNNLTTLSNGLMADVGAIKATLSGDGAARGLVADVGAIKATLSGDGVARRLVADVGAIVATLNGDGATR